MSAETEIAKAALARLKEKMQAGGFLAPDELPLVTPEESAAIDKAVPPGTAAATETARKEARPGAEVAPPGPGDVPPAAAKAAPAPSERSGSVVEAPDAASLALGKKQADESARQSDSTGAQVEAGMLPVPKTIAESAEAGAGNTLTRMNAAASGEKPTVSSLIGLGKTRAGRAIDYLIEATTSPSIMAGQTVFEYLKSRGFEEAELVGIATELGTSVAGLAANPTGFLGALGMAAKGTAKGTSKALGAVGRAVTGAPSPVARPLAGTKAADVVAKSGAFDPHAAAAAGGDVYQGEWKDIPGGAHEFKNLGTNGNFTVTGELTEDTYKAARAQHDITWNVAPPTVNPNVAAAEQVRTNEKLLQEGGAALSRAGNHRALSVQIETLTREGDGATFNIGKGKNLGGTKAFAVAIAPERGKIIQGLAKAADIEAFMKRNQDLLSQPGANVGTWFNKADGNTYLDVSRAVDSQEEALALGQQFRQKAITNLETFEEIAVPVPRTTGHHVYDNVGVPLRETDASTAAAYDALPDFDAAAVPAWDALAAIAHQKLAEIEATGLRVERVSGQPYLTAAEMSDDIDRGVMRVTIDNSDHPLWDLDTNFAFRVWHDYEHYLHGNDFTLDGEWRAYQVGSNGISDPLARKALLVEVYGQAASSVASGGLFPPQKVGFFDDAIETAANLPSIEDRLVTPAGPAIEKALETGSWSPKKIIPAAAATDVALTLGQEEDPNDPSSAYVAAPLTTIAATLLLGKKLSLVQKNALANKAAGLLWRGAKSEREFKKLAQAEFGPTIAKELDGVWAKGQAQFDKLLGGLKLRKVEEIGNFFREGRKVAGEWAFPDWYGAGHEIVETFGTAPTGPAGIHAAEMFAKLLAATSPQTAVQNVGAKQGNVSLAIEALAMLKKGATRPEIINHFDSSHGPNIWRAWGGEELDGNKVQDFWKAIYVGALGKGDSSRAVIDGHMIPALIDPSSERVSLPSTDPKTGRPRPQVTINLTTTKDMSDAEYSALSEFVTNFANLHGVTPREAQQAIWIGRKLSEGNEIGDTIEPLMATVNRMWLENGIEEDAFKFFEGKKALTVAAVVLGAVAANEELGDADSAVEEWAGGVGLAGLLNPKAVKALAQVVRTMRRARSSVEVAPATLMRTGQYLRQDSGTLQVGKKMMSIDWSTMGHSVDNMRETLKKVKEVFDTEGVHAYSRGIVGDADEAKLAKHILEETGYDVSLALKRAAGEGVNSSWVWATAALMRKGMARLGELETAVKTAATDTPAGLMAEIEMAEQLELVGTLARAFDGGLEEVGRALRAARYAKDVTDEPRLIFLRERAERIAKGIVKPITEAGDPANAAKLRQGATDPRQGPPEAAQRGVPVNPRPDPRQGPPEAPQRGVPVNPRQAAGDAPAAAGAPAGADDPLARLTGLAEQSQDPAQMAPPVPKVRPPGDVPTGLSDIVDNAAQTPAQGKVSSFAAGPPKIGGNQQQSALAQLRATLAQAQKFGNTAGPGNVTAYRAMLQTPAVQALLMNMRKVRAGYTQLPPVARPSFIKNIAEWGYEAGWEAFFSSMLSTIPGNLANAFGSGLMLTREHLARFMTAMEPWNEYGFATHGAYTSGMFESLGEAFISAGKTAWTTESKFGSNQKVSVRAMTGEAVSEAFAGGTLSDPVKQAINAMGLAVNIGSRTMIGVDEFVKVIAFRGSLAEQGAMDAIRQGLTPGTHAYSRAVTAFKLNPPDDAAKIAIAHAQYVTFTRDLGHGSIEGLQRFLQNPAAKVFVPFFKVAANIMDVSLESTTGLSMLQNKIRHDIRAGGVAAEIAANKLAIGAASMALAVYLYENGNLTGRIVNEKKLEKHLKDQNIKADSFIYRDADGVPHSFPLERFDPITGPFLLIADTMDVYYAHTDQPLSPDTLAEAGVALTLGSWHNFLDRPWMSGMKNFLEAVSADDKKDVEKGLKALRSPGVSVLSFPTGAAGGQIERFRYPILPETYDWVDQLYAKLPWGTIAFDPKTGQQRKNPYSLFGGTERTLYPKRKLNGEPYMPQPWEGLAALTPLPMVKGQPDVVSQALHRNEVRVPEVARTMKGTGAPDGVLPLPGGREGGVVLNAKNRDHLAVLQGNGVKMPAKMFEPVLRGLGATGELPAGKWGMWDFMTELVKTPGFKSLHSGPGSVQADILNTVIGNYRRAAENILLVEDKELRDKFIDHLVNDIGHKFGPDFKDTVSQKMEGPEGRARIDEKMGSPDITKFIQGLTQ